MRLAALALVALATIAPGATGCAATGDEEEASDTEDAVVVDNRSPLAKAQYRANVAFANDYRARCARSGSGRRVLVTGFGRFMHIQDNATGRIVSHVVDMEYPLTNLPEPNAVDSPEPQTKVGQRAVRLEKSGDVQICAMVLPVYWDLASILIAKEIETFEPDLVIMNGVAGSRQELYIELGSVNRAMRSADGSNVLEPYAPEGREPVIIQGASALRGLRLSWDTVQSAAARSIERRAAVADGDTKLGDVLLGAKLAGYPRGGNTYLCNNVTYVTNYLMDRPGRPVTLLKALDRRGPEDDYIRIGISHDMRKTPRVFMHWPSDIVGHRALIPEAAGVLEDVIDAQLHALATQSEVPSLGNNERADPSLRGGSFF